MESGMVRTTASASLLINAEAIRLILSGAASPAISSGCGTTFAAGGSGWSGQTASSGLLPTATSAPPAFSVALRSFATEPMVWSHGS